MMLLRWLGVMLLAGMMILLSFANFNHVFNLWLTLAMGVMGLGFVAYSEHHLQEQNRHSIFSDVLEAGLDALEFGCEMFGGIFEFFSAF